MSEFISSHLTGRNGTHIDGRVKHFWGHTTLVTHLGGLIKRNGIAR
jgi:hypothetical protein